MKGAAIHVVTLLLGLCPLASAGQSQVHPIGKVVNMLKGLSAKTKMMGKIEANSYSKFQAWCNEQSSTLIKAIDEEKGTIGELEDTIAGKTKEQKGLETQIDELSEQITDLEASAMQAKKVRADEASLFTSSRKDFTATIKAVGDALSSLKKAGTSTKTGLLQAQRKAKQAMALLGAFATEEQRSAVNEFLREDAPPLLAKGDKAAALDKYNFKSGNVVDLLKAMETKFQDDKRAAMKAETNALNAYELSSKARTDASQAAQDSKTKKGTELAEVKKTLSEAKGDLKNLKADLDADTGTLAETKKSCLTKQDEWEKRSQTRKLELEAMDMAIKILSKVTGVRTKAPKNPGMPSSPVKFLQLLSVGVGADPKLRAVNLLKETAKTVHSRALERLAVEIGAHLDGPFNQVNNMIQKMIFRLMDEQTSEDTHKQWCDQELAKTKAMKESKDDKIEELDAKIKTETAGVAQLTEDVKAADNMITSIVASMAEATEIRTEGKKENTETIADAEAGQAAILKAIGVLQSFYQDSGMVQESSFLEAPVDLPKTPSTWDSGYTGVTDPSQQPAGIISVLKAVNADFAKLEGETRSQETTDQHAFDEQIKMEQIEKARRTKEVEMKANQKMQKVDSIAQMTGVRKNIGSEQEKAAQYLKDLEPACVSGDSTYEARKKARDQEIGALKKAQASLESTMNGAFLSKAQVHVPK